MIIGILGGTGRTGIALRTHFLQRGDSVISLIRHPEKFVAQNEKDNYIIGSATNQEDVATIVKQVDILIDTTSVGFFHTKPTTLYSSVAETIIAARPQGIATHLIVMSSAGTHHGRELPWPANRGYEFFLGDVANDKEKAEALLDASALPRTIIKSPMLTSGEAKTYSIQSFAHYKVALFDNISRKTLGNVVTKIITNQQNYLKQKIVAYED